MKKIIEKKKFTGGGTSDLMFILIGNFASEEYFGKLSCIKFGYLSNAVAKAKYNNSIANKLTVLDSDHDLMTEPNGLSDVSKGVPTRINNCFQIINLAASEH